MFWWPSTRTCKTRYVGDIPCERWRYDSSSDVIELVKECAASRRKRSLRILDVGCSTGAALAYMKNVLSESGLKIATAGVDPAPEVFDCAKRNLGRFYEGCIGDVEIEDEYDVVLCPRLLRFATPREQAELLAKCAEHCAPDGVLITDCVLSTMRNTYHTVSKSRARDYAASIVPAWDSMGRWFCFERVVRQRGGYLAKLASYILNNGTTRACGRGESGCKDGR